MALGSFAHCRRNTTSSQLRYDSEVRRASMSLAMVVLPHWRGPETKAILCPEKQSCSIGVSR